jgi:hypothetical protein
MEDYMLPCVNKSLFGIDCFGCGIQRAFVLVFRGEFTAAFQMFPAVYTTLLFIAFLGLHLIDKSRSYHKIVIFLAITNAILMVTSYFYKLINL